MADEVGGIALAGALTAGEGRVGAAAPGLDTDTPVVGPAVAEALTGADGRLGLVGPALTEADAVG